MKQIKSQIKSVKLKISKGSATKDEVRLLVRNLEKLYKKEKKNIFRYIEFFGFQELKRRLETSVFSEKGKLYPVGYKNFCMYGELKNTNLFVSTIKKLIKASQKKENFLTGIFWGFPDSNFTLTWEFVVHMLFRHNNVIQGFRNFDSTLNGYNPTTMPNLAVPICKLYMILDATNESDWNETESRENHHILNVEIAETCYSIIRNSSTGEILTFYPRKNCDNIETIKLARKNNDFRMEKTNV